MTDFWWLIDTEKRKYVYLELAHHQPVGEEDDAPSLNPCLVLISDITKWRDCHSNANIYRSRKIWTDTSKIEELFGPFILDIDNDHDDLEDALGVYKQTIQVLRSYNVRDSEIRVFFTGHKGFNIEVLPSAFGIVGAVDEQERKEEQKRKEIIENLRQGKNLGNTSMIRNKDGGTKVICLGSNSVSANGTCIDPPHDFTRLHDSINKWIQDNTIRARRKREFTIDELNKLSLDQIIAKSTI